MAVTKQARRALRVSGRKQVFNLRRKRAMKGAIKEVSDLATSDKLKDAQGKLGVAYKAIDKASKAGIIPKNRASRKKSKLSKLVSTK